MTSTSLTNIDRLATKFCFSTYRRFSPKSLSIAWSLTLFFPLSRKRKAALETDWSKPLHMYKVDFREAFVTTFCDALLQIIRYI